MKKLVQFLILLITTFLSCSTHDDNSTSIDPSSLSPEEGELIAIINGSKITFTADEITLISSENLVQPKEFKAERVLESGYIETIQFNSFIFDYPFAKNTYNLSTFAASYSITNPEDSDKIVDNQLYYTSTFNNTPSGNLSITELEFGLFGKIAMVSGTFEFTAYKDYTNKVSDSIKVIGAFKNIVSDNI
ncbi:hypothetical protein LG651_14315 [Tamlana sp. 62-3]|uniref:Uncharacterized protein n=1 Tax=Neotamlana sargassicola TaxID=2883125 RepID=A0A9X1I7U6_9FLAO|nr:hypothetical protein [Tamlana sargassicola]MCB4809426.1 hypothetical protein [Tamlana sargassicola]